MTIHYLDNSATTRVSENAAKKAYALMTEEFANPSSLHSMGFRASKELENARDTVASALGAESSEIIFTSGGSEANCLAILGAAHAHKKRGGRIVTSALEHSSVYDTMLHLKEEGFDVVFLPTKAGGKIDIDAAFEAIDERTILVSLMHTNNEVGIINPVEELKKIIKHKNSPALIHVDAVQAFGKTDIKVSRTGCDLLTVSSHKIHGPKGVGALYIRKGVRILPLTFGGKQERKLRPGTEALPLIGAFGEAVKELNIKGTTEHVRALNTYLREQLSEIDGIVINSPEDASPYILNFSTCAVRSETMLHHLAARDVFVSSGSACSKGGKSHVLEALSLPDEVADTAIRVSFSKHNTKDDCDALIEGIRDGLSTLARR